MGEELVAGEHWQSQPDCPAVPINWLGELIDCAFARKA